jgi:hypothetical protein
MTHRLAAVPLLPEHRESLSRIADVLIPGGSGLPSAGDADIVGEPLDRVLALEPGLSQTLTEVALREGSADTVVDDLRTRERETYERLVFALSGAYFMVPRVRKALGYPGVAPRRAPAAADEAEFYLEDDILQAVIDRGAIHRPAPEVPQSARPSAQAPQSVAE